MNYYELLGLPLDASFDDIRGAYFAAARRMHPDVTADKETQEDFLEIQEAYETLANISRRSNYDKTLAFEEQTPLYTMQFITSRNQISPKKEAQLVYGLLKFSPTGEIDVSRQMPRHISLVIDRSTSMKGERMDVVKANVLQLFKKLNPQDVISIVVFSDRAELLIPPTRAENYQRFEYSVMSLNTYGGTEIFTGLELGYKQLIYSADGNTSSHLILLTDGHTYGDEEKCFSLARDAATHGIIISGLGIGSEWNDFFLDKLSSISGGNASYVRSSQELADYLDKSIGIKNSVFARNIRIDCYRDPCVSLEYAYRISPQTNEIESYESIPLGVLCYREELAVICEFKINDLPLDKDEIKIIDGYLLFSFPDEPKPRRVYLNQTLRIRAEKDDWQPPVEIMKALSKINLYRMHEKVRNQVKTGNIEGATQYLKNMATNLLSIGDFDLAKVVIRESDHIQKHQQLSQEGDKRIKYGTRALMLPSGQEN